MQEIQQGFAHAVVMFGGDGMGQGDEVLRRKLAANYLRVLAEAGSPPRAILLFGAGVKLASRDSPCREALDALARLGCQVIACRTCLEHYGLMSTVPEDEIGNMLMIVEAQAAAAKVIAL